MKILEIPMEHKSGYGLNLHCKDHNNVRGFARVIPAFSPDTDPLEMVGEKATHNIIGFWITINTMRFFVDCEKPTELSEIKIWIGKYYARISHYIEYNENLSPKEITQWAQKYTSTDYTLFDVLRGINALEEDIDITVEWNGSIAVTVPIKLSKTAKAYFQTALSLPVRERVVCCDIEDDLECQKQLSLAWELLCSLAGHCSTQEFTEWFEYGEQL